MPAYNSEEFIREAIDSVLGQTFQEFEIVIIDDGSTDSTGEIVKSYKDERIKYFRKKHGGVANALNYGLSRCTGEYVARFDSDDRMFQDRLEYQVSVMDGNEDIDIAGFGMQWGNGKPKPEYFSPLTKKLSLDDFKRGNPMSHPTVIMRRKSILSLPFQYEPYYTCEDFKLWITALMHGLSIYTFSKPVIWYRQHKGQVVSANYGAIISDSERARKSCQFEDGGELTCVIAGRNEKDEVERTMSSIRSTADKVRILFVDDASDDGWNYKSICDMYKAKYVRNDVPMGSAGSKNKGVNMVETKYFCLFDCHMRLYENGWDIRLVKVLEENPNTIVTSASLGMSKNSDGDYFNENGQNRRDVMRHGAYVNLYEDGWEFTEKWTNKYLEKPSDGVVPVTCVLGAVYASSVSFWKHIHGLDGLVFYGHEEPFMSMKAWLAGGKCLLLKDWDVGHLYRGKQPFQVPSNVSNANQLFLERFFTDDSERLTELEDRLRKRIGQVQFERSASAVDTRKLETEREYFKGIQKMTMEDFDELNQKVRVI